MNDLEKGKAPVEEKKPETIEISVEDYRQLLQQLEEANIDAASAKREGTEFFSKNFWDSVCVKVLTTLISVKVWSLGLSIAIPGFLLLKGYISSANFATIVVGVWTVVLGAREYFKVAAVKANGNSDSGKKKRKIMT